MALGLTGAYDEAIVLTDGLVATAESTHNPFLLAHTLVAVGLVAQASGNRFGESHAAVVLSPLEAQHGSPEAAFRYLTLAIRNYFDSGNIATSRSPLAILAGLLCQLGHHEPSAAIADFADDPLTRIAFSEITTTIAHLREVLGDDRYESLGQVGRTMTNAAMANYAFEQIDLARAKLSQPTTPT